MELLILVPVILCLVLGPLVFIAIKGRPMKGTCGAQASLFILKGLKCSSCDKADICENNTDLKKQK